MVKREIGKNRIYLIKIGSGDLLFLHIKCSEPSPINTQKHLANKV